jgi:parallel beta-helix repeat protein
MRKEVVLAALFVSIFLLSSTQVMAASTITVPDDYPTIQEAVDAASDGDTITVREGTYNENVDVTKQLTIISENGADSTTVTAADEEDHVFYVTAEYVTIDGFTVTGATGMDESQANEEEKGRAGIFLGDGAGHCTISDNIVFSNYYGIRLTSSSDNTISNNEVHSNTMEGIYLWTNCNNNVIDGNTAYSNGGHGGIFLWLNCKNNVITNNYCHSNPDHGIKIHESSDNTLIENNLCVDNGGTGIFVGFSDNNVVKDNTVISGPELGIILRVANDNLVINNNCSYNGMTGIALDFANYGNTIKDNICYNNNIGISVRMSTNENTVTGNKCRFNDFMGLHILSSESNNISYNTFTENSGGGIQIEGGKLISQDNENYEWDVFVQMGGPWSKFKDRISDIRIEADSHDSSGNKINHNTITGNSGISIDLQAPSDVDASNNWWGDSSGPFHPQKNPEGKGEEFHERNEGIVIYKPWLASSPEGEIAEQAEVISSTGEAGVGGTEVVQVGSPFLIIITVVIIVLIAVGFVIKKIF